MKPNHMNLNSEKRVQKSLLPVAVCKRRLHNLKVSSIILKNDENVKFKKTLDIHHTDKQKILKTAQSMSSKGSIGRVSRCTRSGILKCSENHKLNYANSKSKTFLSQSKQRRLTKFSVSNALTTACNSNSNSAVLNANADDNACKTIIAEDKINTNQNISDSEDDKPNYYRISSIYGLHRYHNERRQTMIAQRKQQFTKNSTSEELKCLNENVAIESGLNPKPDCRYSIYGRHKPSKKMGDCMINAYTHLPKTPSHSIPVFRLPTSCSQKKYQIDAQKFEVEKPEHLNEPINGIQFAFNDKNSVLSFECSELRLQNVRERIKVLSNKESEIAREKMKLLEEESKLKGILSKHYTSNNNSVEIELKQLTTSNNNETVDNVRALHVEPDIEPIMATDAVLAKERLLQQQHFSVDMSLDLSGVDNKEQRLNNDSLLKTPPLFSLSVCKMQDGKLDVATPRTSSPKVYRQKFVLQRSVNLDINTNSSSQDEMSLCQNSLNSNDRMNKISYDTTLLTLSPISPSKCISSLKRNPISMNIDESVDLELFPAYCASFDNEVATIAAGLHENTDCCLPRLMEPVASSLMNKPYEFLPIDH